MVQMTFLRSQVNIKQALQDSMCVGIYTYYSKMVFALQKQLSNLHTSYRKQLSLFFFK